MHCNKTKKYHFIGIGGIGMSGIARLLLDGNCEVSGSDIATSPIIERLKERKARIFIGHAAQQVASDATIVLSTDIKKGNPEFAEALRLGCRTLHRSQMLAEIMKGHRTLTVTGTHGKTTTSALLAWTLHCGGLDPSFCVGGILPQFESNANLGKGDCFVAEADESDGSFLHYDSFGAIVTNIDLDHMDYYKEESKLIEAFIKFLSQVKNKDLLFWCEDDSRLREIASQGVSYGFNSTAECRCSNPRQSGWTSYFDLEFDGKIYKDIELGLIGVHNILNATAVFGMGLRLGVSEAHIRRGLQTFGGVGRRCEKKGEHDSVLFLDDYAHHPTEISTTLKAIRKAIPDRRLVVVFQPHRYTRTRDCLGQFGTVFNGVDELILTDVYGSGEPAIPGINSHVLLEEINALSDVVARYICRDNLVVELKEHVKANDVVVTVGAGNITKVGSEVLTELRRKSE